MKDEELRSLQFQFVGAVLGVYVHEANNRLATFQETVGLLGDLLRSVSSGRGEGVKEGLRIAAGLEKQVTRFSVLNRHLEGFAGRLLSPEGAVELPQAIDELLNLTERLARQKRIRIEKEVPRSVPPLRLEPVTFLFLIHHLVSRGCELLPSQGTLRLRVLRERGATVVGIHAVELSSPVILADVRSRELARRLGARIEELPGRAEIRICFQDSA